VIVVYTGKQGEGKSYSLAKMACVQGLQQGREVVSNLAITDPVTGHSAQEWDVLRDGFDAVCHLQGALIVLDEGPVFLNARDFEKRSTKLFFALLAQVRRNRNTFALTAQNFTDLDVWLRRQTHLVVRCRVAFRDPFHKDPSGWQNVWTGKTYKRPLLIRQSALMAEDAELSAESRHKRRVGARWVRFEPRYAGSFDSWAAVQGVQRPEALMPSAVA
jgi:hypothetical protein